MKLSFTATIERVDGGRLLLREDACLVTRKDFAAALATFAGRERVIVTLEADTPSVELVCFASIGQRLTACGTVRSPRVRVAFTKDQTTCPDCRAQKRD